MVDLRRFQTDPMVFFNELRLPGVRGRLGEAMAPFQRDAFQAMAPALRAIAIGRTPEICRFWVERTKGGSKDTDLAAVLLWLLVFSRRALHIQVGAADRDQADELRRAAVGIIRTNEWLGRIVDVLEHRLRNPRTGSEAEIIALDVFGSHGSRPDVLVLNELVHVPKREFAENLMDNTAKVGGSLTIIATNAGFMDTWQWRWREQARCSGRWWFQKVAEPAPWLDPAAIEEAERRNPPSRFRRLFRGEWISGTGDALDPTWIDRSIRDSGPMAGRQFCWRFGAGLDLSTRHDFSALVVVGRHVGGFRVERVERRPATRIERILRETGAAHVNAADEVREIWEDPKEAYRLADARVWRPSGGSIDLGVIEREVVRQWRRFRFVLYYDPWQGEYLGQRLRRHGMRAEPLAPTGSNLEAQARELLSAFREGRLDLYESDDASRQLVRDLRSLSIVEKSYGYRLVSASARREGHGDVAAAFALGLLAAHRIKVMRPMRRRLLIG